jgi:hypothetical protein
LARQTSLAGFDDIHIASRQQWAHSAERTVGYDDFPALDVEDRLLPVRFGVAGMIFEAQADVQRQAGRDLIVIRDKVVLRPPEPADLDRGKGAGGAGRDSQQEIGVRMSGKTI